MKVNYTKNSTNKLYAIQMANFSVELSSPKNNGGNTEKAHTSTTAVTNSREVWKVVCSLMLAAATFILICQAMKYSPSSGKLISAGKAECIIIHSTT